MKKLAISIALFIGVACQAQQDFNYTIFTRHRQVSVFKSRDSTMLELEHVCSIIKTNTTIEVVNLQNTGNSYKYEVSYQGTQWDGERTDHMWFYYSVNEGPAWVKAKYEYYILVDPIRPMMEIHSYKDRKYIDKYY